MSDRSRQAMQHITKREKRNNLAPPRDEPWLWMTRAMLMSPAFAALSRSGLKVLTRLCVEHMDHAGRENGRLAVSYNAFETFGVERRSIAKALDELDGLGFMRRSEAGRKAYGTDPGRVATYRLTFAGTVGIDGRPPTDDWRRITPTDAARVVSSLAKRRRGGKEAVETPAEPVPLRKAAAALRRAG